MVFGDNIEVDKAYGVDDPDDNETSYSKIMTISVMTIQLIPGDFFWQY